MTRNPADGAGDEHALRALADELFITTDLKLTRGNEAVRTHSL